MNVLVSFSLLLKRVKFYSHQEVVVVLHTILIKYNIQYKYK